MEKYVQETPGSQIITGEYTVKWNYEGIAEKEICQEQEKALARHLRQVFGGLKLIEIKEGEGVEVKPVGVSWKIFLQIIMEKLWEEKNELDFVLAIVTEEENEMIQALLEMKAKLGENYTIPCEREFLCVVGTDNRYANCYLNSKEEAYQLLQELSEGEKNQKKFEQLN